MNKPDDRITFRAGELLPKIEAAAGALPGTNAISVLVRIALEEYFERHSIKSAAEPTETPASVAAQARRDDRARSRGKGLRGRS